MSIVAQLAALHFLRPLWLLALLLLPPLISWWHRRQRQRSVWQKLIDPHLLPHLLESHGGTRGQLGMWSLSLAFVLAVLALAGPTWRQSDQPLWETRTPLIVALDLSSTMLASDLPPSRLAQARAKLSTLLRERKGGQVGLVAFAGDAFTVAALTDDAANVALFLDALQPDVMPRDGQRADEAVAWSAELLRRAGAMQGEVLLITDHADAAAIHAAADAAAAGYRVSVLGVGSEAGAAYKRADGSIARAALDASSLRELARSGDGRYQPLASEDSDLKKLGVLDPGSAEEVGKGNGGLAWRDEGYWLLLPLMLLALFAFRRNGAAMLAVAMLCSTAPLGSVHAADLWRRPDQQAYAKMQRANQAYRKGEYQTAADQYAGLDSATAHYNRGNALAKAGQYPQALRAYDEALKRQPGMPDAVANRRAVEAAMKRQQPSGSQGQQSAQSKGSQGQASPQSSPDRQDRSSPQSSPTQPSDAKRQAKSKTPQNPESAPASPEDAMAQAEADRAQRERMQRALQQRQDQRDQQNADKKQTQSEETPQQRERRLANEAWLRRIPDDPGGLLRAKFRLEYERRAAKGEVGQ